MQDNKFYPTLDSLVPLDNLPDGLGLVKDGLQNVFSKVYYKDFVFFNSLLGDRIDYKITILSPHSPSFQKNAHGKLL